MKILIGEYGRAILAMIVGGMVIGMGTFFLTGTLNLGYYDAGKEIPNTSNTQIQRPVIIAPNCVRVQKGNQLFEPKQYVTVYEDETREKDCDNVIIKGLDDLDINQVGNYQLIIVATNQRNHTSIEEMNILVF